MTNQDARGPGRTYRGQPEDRRREDRRRRLLEAGRAGFAAAGNTVPPVSEVCTRAGVSKRYFYELYDDRLDLLRALHEEAIAWIQEGFEPDSHPDDATAWVREVVVPWVFARLREDPVRGRILAISAAQLGDRPVRTLADVVVEGLVARAGRTGGTTAAPEQVRRHALAAVMAGRALVVEWLVHGPPGGSPGDRAPGDERAKGYLRDTISVATATLAPVLPASPDG